MKKILLVIFFFALISSIMIYKNRPIKEKVLFIGEKEYLKDINYDKYDVFLYDNITFKQLINSIKNNDYIIIKNKKVYLNQLLANSNKILIGVNNIEYNKKCNNKEINIQTYNNRIELYKKELLNILEKMSYSKIIIMDNYCDK